MPPSLRHVAVTNLGAPLPKIAPEDFSADVHGDVLEPVALLYQLLLLVLLVLFDYFGQGNGLLLVLLHEGHLDVLGLGELYQARFLHR